jgi:AcrR family transcriptional regulator
MTSNRSLRRQEQTDRYLNVALAIAAKDGIGAVTMTRLAREAGASLGAAYRYFPSKGALLAAVQIRAIEAIEQSYLAAVPTVEALVANRSESQAAVARLVFFGRFLCAVSLTHPQEMRLMHLLMNSAEDSMTIEDAMMVYPSAIRLLAWLQAAMTDAERLGVLDPGDAMDRTIEWVAALAGVLQVSNLARLDSERFDGVRLGIAHAQTLLCGWGAPRAEVTWWDATFAAELNVNECAPRIAPMAAGSSPGLADGVA